MTIDEIREQIAEKLRFDFNLWNDAINDTIPGNYGCDYWDVELSYEDIWVDIQKKSFNVKKGFFSADLTLGESRGDTSFNQSYNKEFAAQGKFIFSNENKSVDIGDVEISIDPYIY